MGKAFHVCSTPLADDLSTTLAMVGAIPDGIRLANFPSHCEGIQCWCRPEILAAGDAIIVRHKDLTAGEFDG